MAEKRTMRWQEIAILLVLLLIVAWNVSSFFSLTKLPFLDPTTGQLPRVLAVKEAAVKYHDFFPLWNPYLMGGTPLTDASISGIFSVMGLLIFLFPTVTGLNLSYPIAVVLAALFMYLLARYLFKDAWVAALVSLVYSSTGYVMAMLTTSSLYQLYGYAMMPLILLFTFKAIREKKYILNAVLAGILLGIEMRISVDMKITLFLSLAMAAIFLVHLMHRNFTKNLIRLTIIGLLICAIGFGLDAQKILPTQQTIASGSRSQLSYASSAERSVSLGDFFQIGVQPLAAGWRVRYDAVTRNRIPLPNPRDGEFAMGIVATLLAAFGLYKNRKNKIAIAMGATLLIAFLVITASPFYYFLWKYIPPWSSFHYVERGFSIWALGISILMGFGIVSLKEWAGKRKPRIKPKWIIAAVGVLLILNILVFNRAPLPDYFCPVQQLLQQNPVSQFYEQHGGIYRVHEWETHGIDWPTDPFVVYAGKEHLYGYTGTWIPQYMNEYLSVAMQEPAKFWGIMNVKYVSSMTPLNVSGFTLATKVPPYTGPGANCIPTQEQRAFGPYIYQNNEFLPRAYISTHAILIIGADQQVRALTYQIMLDPRFDPSSTVLVMSTHTPIESLPQSELDKFDGIILASAEAVDQGSYATLAALKQNGAVLLPDILAGQTQANASDLRALLVTNKTGTPIPDSSIITQNFETQRIGVPASPPGFLVLSDRYFYFPGWHAQAGDTALPLDRANGFVTALPLDGSAQTITLQYQPLSATIGTAITIITLLALAAYFAAYAFALRRRKVGGRKNRAHNI